MTDLSANPDNHVPFLDAVAPNQKANIKNFPGVYDLLRRMNICLAAAGQNMTNPKPVMSGVLFQRCQYAYKAAAGMALSGQAVEAFVMARSCSNTLATLWRYSTTLTLNLFFLTGTSALPKWSRKSRHSA